MGDDESDCGSGRVGDEAAESGDLAGVEAGGGEGGAVVAQDRDSFAVDKSDQATGELLEARVAVEAEPGKVRDRRPAAVSVALEDVAVRDREQGPGLLVELDLA